MITDRNVSRTRLWLLACAAAAPLVLGCTERLPGEDAPAGPDPVAFDAYLNRGVRTRAGSAGELSTAALRDGGFGVFAYHTGTHSYGFADRPDFMYNQEVAYAGGRWTYEPVKYWPNAENGGVGQADRVSFFAYAPYVPADPTTGTPSGPESAAGIVGLSPSLDAGDPAVAYKVSFVPSGSVDLCWSAPALDVVKPVHGSQDVSFTFDHALASLNVQVDAVVDGTDAPGPDGPGGDTRIYVRSVTFEGFAAKGSLNLNSPASAPQWGGYPQAGGTPDHAPITVHDGRLDGAEAAYDDPAETPSGLNPDLVQQTGYNDRPGVTETTRNLFGSVSYFAPVYVIPNGYPLKVTLVYDVETRDDKLAGSLLSDGTTHGSSTRVAVSTYVNTESGTVRMEPGKKYVLRLHLGLTSVKFGAEIGVSDDWSEDPHSVIFEPVAVGQEYTDYYPKNKWVES